MKLHWLIVLLAVANAASAAKILGLLAMPSKSHGILMERVLRELATKGHEITYITASPPLRGPLPHGKIIKVSDMQNVISGIVDDDTQHNMFKFKDMSPWFFFLFSLFMGPQMCEEILKTPEVEEVLNSNQHFDLILAEAFLQESLMAGFSHKFKAPIVAVQAFMPNIWGNYLTGNPAPSSYIPDPNLGYSTNMNFFERTYNFVYTTIFSIFHPYIYLRYQDSVMRKYFGGDLPLINDILLNTSLVLVNHHYGLGFSRAYLPNMVEVGGMHINPVRPLPDDLKTYLDNSKNGAIFFSMGSNLKSSQMDPELIKKILRAFESLPYNILWKFEEELPNLPKNVKISNWLPQSDILAHPNVKLFITHGGLLSTTESVERGVPVLGIPIFGDQPINMKHTENAGLGRTLQFDDITTENLVENIKELIGNPKYMEAAKLHSAILRDTMNTSIEKAVWWVEYVIKYKGAPHLRSQVQRMAWYELYQVDVIAALLVGVWLASHIFCKIIKLTRRLCSKGSKTQTSEKKKTKKTD